MVINYGSFYDFPHLFDKLMNDLHDPQPTSLRGATFPPLYISEDDVNVYVRALLPGAAMEDVELAIEDNTLVLRGELKPVQGKYHQQERPTGSFQRLVKVNVPIHKDGITATMKSGMLFVQLPKSTAMQPHTIHIQPR
ncbi:Hsp20/alpha crystallin family protein [Halodesulfovibrio marinisediminis]|uniref:HSP20 family protein n=1 Tax=Halodesulfovibrio marinisediminis DSM 17456 TaxID=1121457 RepID=A0A1N6H2W3_9BACT|nr:Hsp20/alpha crystallin family protein [Halodesulfovibrio marinisediminis]SIO14120.1 HSP20 family protein [Halodesulfovibrio marinisediminis DSM 17456]